MKKIDTVNEFIDVLNSQRIVIFGTGYVAKRFYQVLKEKQLENKVLNFITSNGSTDTIDNKPILSVAELGEHRKCMVCIAVHESLVAEIEELCKKNRITNFIWVYPFLYELMLGEPIKKQVEIPVARLVHDYQDDYRMASRYLAIDNYFHKNDKGYEIYVKSMQLYCDLKTADKRLETFVQVIRNWETNGYDRTRPIKILENNQVFDGAHRLALASYFGQKEIVCDVYSAHRDISQIHCQEAVLTKQSLINGNFNKRELELLEITNLRIGEQYK